MSDTRLILAHIVAFKENQSTFIAETIQEVISESRANMLYAEHIERERRKLQEEEVDDIEIICK